MLYQEKSLDLTVIILSIDGDSSKIEKTYQSSKFLCDTYQSLAVAPEKKKVTEISCPIYYGGDFVTSLLDTGMCKIKTEWGYCVFAGSIIKKNIDRKLSLYIETEKDVLFPVVNRMWNFIDGSMNGLLINKKFYTEVGEFGSGNSLQNTKLLWAERALNKGVKFKAIVNACNY